MTARIAFSLALALAFQVVAGPLYDLPLGPWTVRPAFVLALVAAGSLAGEAALSWRRAVLIGLGLDAISLDPWGAQAAALGVAAVVAASGRRAGLRQGLLGGACLVAAAIAAEAARGFVLWLWHEEGAWPPLAPALGGAVLTGLASFCILPLLQLCRRGAPLEPA